VPPNTSSTVKLTSLTEASANVETAFRSTALAPCAVAVTAGIAANGVVKVAL
jgi:hypothetical protein